MISDYLTSANLAHPTLRHGFFTRQGGISTGVYAGLNCGPGSADLPENVAANRALVAGAMGVAPSHLLLLWQSHSVDVLAITEPFIERPKADGMVTNVPGLALGVLAADCGPLLFADPEAGVIGAAHAGWRGALGGILENTLAAMEKLGASRQRIKGVLGPCIGPKSYEVDAEFRQKFIDVAESYSQFFIASMKPGHFQFDLPAFLKSQAITAGLRDFTGLGIDTYSDDRCFSYRRKTHRQEPDYGRQISVITLT